MKAKLVKESVLSDKNLWLLKLKKICYKINII